ncbi:hypothetical protein Ssi02_09240 [Sinosporangium siamense]|uniref:AAA family ATPase n=1 Tax=Sinosporangium siamense TaxID=1367973 RepID=A0A919V4N5_9ACTN|nr:hypothetical protein Ssi02_09240 [Sinosporangium siamense]
MESSIYTYVARLRRSFEPKRTNRAPSELLVGDRSGYLLQLDPRQVDAYLFEEHLADARRLQKVGSPTQAVTAFDAALAFWQGTAFGGTVGPFADNERTRLNELRLSACEDRAKLLLDLGRPADVIRDISPLALEFPLRERFRHLLMVAYYRSGRQADALAEYRDARQRLISELGIEPQDELQRCHTQILSGAPELTLYSTGPQHEPAVAGPSWTAPAQLPRDVPGFTGRRREMEGLHTFVREAEASGEAGLILVNGAPGVGKSALALRLAHELADRFTDGQLHLDLNGFSADSQPMTALEGIGHLLYGLVQTHPMPYADLERQAALYRSMVAGQRLLIVLDNAKSAHQVRPLLPGSPSCLVIVTSRNRLSGLTTRDGARRMTLGAMSDDDAVELLRRFIGRGTETRGHGDLQELTDTSCRLPVALRTAAEHVISRSHARGAERLASLVRREDLLDGVDADGDELSSLRVLYSWSYRGLPEESARVFRLMALLGGPDVDLPTLATMAGHRPNVARQHLNPLLNGHLIRETCLDRFTFHDELLRAYARELGCGEDFSIDHARPAVPELAPCAHSAGFGISVPHPHMPLSESIACSGGT